MILFNVKTNIFQLYNTACNGTYCLYINYKHVRRKFPRIRKSLRCRLVIYVFINSCLKKSNGATLVDNRAKK